MSLDEPGSRSAIRAPSSDGKGWAGAVRGLLSSWTTVRWGAVFLVIGGLVSASAGLLSGWLLAREFSSAGYGPSDERIWMVSDVLHGVGSLLATVGLLGLYAALTKSSRWLARLAGLGALVAVSLGLGLGFASLYQGLARPFYYGGRGVLEVLFFGGYFGQPVGVVLLGIVALWTRGLGRWRVLPLAVGVLGSPLTFLLMASLVLERSGPPGIFVETVFLASPSLIAGLGWISLGLALFGVEKREAKNLAKDRRTTEDRNLWRARRLYGEAFGARDLSVVDEVSDPDVLVCRTGRRGPREIGREISDLHRAFPDLRSSVEGVTAEDDTVTTHLSFSGTDRGGVLWYPPTNRSVTFGGEYADRFHDGKLVEHGGGIDTAALLARLGLPVAGS